MADTQPPPSGGGSQMLMIMMLFLTIFILFDPTMSMAVGGIASLALYPLIGFQSNYPVITVMLAGFLMVSFSTAVRHYFIDWVTVAERQQKMKDFNKTLRKARMEGNQAEVSKLMKKQMQMTKEQMAQTMDQMKPMIFTMIFLVATFAFLRTFIFNIPGATLSVPWSTNVDMNDSIVCGFQNWIFVYFLISISMAQVIQRILKWIKFSKELERMDSAPDIVKDEEEKEKEDWDDEEETEEDDDWDDEDVEGVDLEEEEEENLEKIGDDDFEDGEIEEEE